MIYSGNNLIKTQELSEKQAGDEKNTWRSHCRGQGAAVRGRRGAKWHVAPEKHNFFVPFSYINALSDSSPEAGWSDFH